ncbi:MAG: hypothetical protein EBX23_04580 [Proteobacteria bacterium]|nr:hypothetical protein [Pseudomonadota bacterium]
MTNVINFPSVEKDRLTEEMNVYEAMIQVKIEQLQLLNQEIVDLTCKYEDALIRLCKLMDIELPEEYDEDDD